jgi:hypothetical protein
MIRLPLIIFIVLVLVYGISAQDAVNADDKVCISKSSAEACVVADKERTALKAQIAVLEQALKDKDAIINKQNVDWAFDKGQIVACQQDKAESRAIITAMIPMLRAKRVGLNIF